MKSSDPRSSGYTLIIKVLFTLPIILLSACISLEPGILVSFDATAPVFSTQLPTGDPSPSNSPTISPPTLTASPLPSLTPIPTSTPTPAATLTPTPTATLEPPIRFAVIGDYGLAGKPAADVASLVKSWHPDFIITTGDNNYPSGSAETIDENIGQYYHEFIYPYKGSYGEGASANRFFPTLGNHDYGVPRAQPYLDYFTLPGNGRYYDFTWGPLHLFALNSDSNEPDGFHKDSLQAGWLKEGLASSTSPWKIVYMHHPPYSSGTHGPVAWIQWPFSEWGASAVLSGHDHTYERLMIDGIPYFINGLGGGPRYEFRSVYPGSEVRYRDDVGAMLVEATIESITFRFINRQGLVIDTFILDNAHKPESLNLYTPIELAGVTGTTLV